MIVVKAYIYSNGFPFKLETIGHIDEKRNFKFLNKQIKKDCLETLKIEFSYKGSVGATLTIPNFIEDETAKSPEAIWKNEEVIRRTAQMIADDGYVLAYKTVWPEIEDGKKYILTYKK